MTFYSISSHILLLIIEDYWPLSGPVKSNN